MRTAGHADIASVPPDMDSWIRTFHEILGMLKFHAKKYVATWTLSYAPRHSEELEAYIDRMDSIATSIIAHVVALEDRAKMKQKAAMGEMRRGSASRHAC